MPEDRQPNKPRAGGRPGRAKGGRAGERGVDRDRGRDRAKGAGKRDFSRPRRDERSDEARTQSQARYDGPPLPEEITGKELDRSMQGQLKSLPDKLAQRVARHLVAAGLLIDSEPRVAYEHTLAARARASRLAVVCEAVGEAAYAASASGPPSG